MKLFSIKNLIDLFTFHAGDSKGGGGGGSIDLKPININSGFGAASFNPKKGTGGYTLNPNLAAMRDIFYSGAKSFAPSAQDTNLFNSVNNYGLDLFNRGTNLDINKMTSDYYNQQQDILQPSRQLENTQLADSLFQTGRTGAGVSYDNGSGYINPEQFSLLKAREAANANMMLSAEDRARAIQANDLQTGLGLFSAANTLRTQPYQNMSNIFGLGTNIESLGFQPLGYAQQFNNSQLQASIAQSQAAQQDSGKGGKGGLIGGIAGSAGGSIGSAIGTKVGGWIGG